MKKILNSLILILGLGLISCGGNEAYNKPVNEKFPKPWKDPNNEEMVSIGRTLVKHNVKVCGEYYIRPNAQQEQEYLIGCSRDGKTWNYYIVWPLIEEIQGPFQDSTITNPR